jgi:SAM-dependent methyltransferase
MDGDVRAVGAEEVAERQKHEELYRAQRPNQLRLSPSAWQRFDRKETPLDYYVATVQRIEAVHEETLLDLGCGDGWLSAVLAMRGAKTWGFDISREAVRIARDRARDNGLLDRCFFFVASFYSMPLRDGAFPAAVGMSILHHLRHKAEAAQELARVVRPGGHAVFGEPFGNLLWLERLRLFVPVASGAPEDPDEWRQQFKYADLAPFAPWFTAIYEEFQLWSRLDRVVSAKWFVRCLNQIDRWLLGHLSLLRPMAREIVLEFRRRP